MNLLSILKEKKKESKNTKGVYWARRLLFMLLMLFSVCCIKLCAEEVVVTPAKAKEYRDLFIAEAKRCIGSPYVYGAVGPDSFDCSGLVYYAARESINVQLPRTAKALYNYCKIIDDEAREAGDLMFFKTTSSGTISHVGIYIGNKQFISAISDGANTGVIVSSLNQDYWKTRYVCSGQFIKSAKNKAEPEEEIIVAEELFNTKENRKEKVAFEDALCFDATVLADWSFFTPEGFEFNYKGIDASLNVKYAGWVVQPGLGVIFRYNNSNYLFQMPVTLMLNVNDYIRLYGGPVLSLKNGKLDLKDIKSSPFPGIVGVAFATPNIEIRKSRIQIVQDVNYTFYNNEDGSALSVKESIGNGLQLSTGVRVTFPLSAVL